MRSAMSVCAVSATLFLGGGGILGSAAVAMADTGSDSGGSSSQTGTGGDTSTGSSASSTSPSNTTTKNLRPGAVIAGIQDRVRTTIRDFTGSFGGSGTTHQTPKVTIFPPPRSQQTATDGAAGSGQTSSSTDPKSTTAGGAPSTDPSTTPSTGPSTAPSTPPTTAPSAPPKPKPASPFSFKPPPVNQLASSVSGSINAATNSARNAIDALPTLLSTLPTSTNPVGDVLATVQSVLTSVGESVTTITEIPGDLSTLLGFPATSTPPAATVGGSTDVLRVTAPAATPMDLLPVLLAPVPATPAVVTPAAPVAAPPAFAGTASVGLSQELASTEPLALHGVSSTGSAASVLERAVSKMLVPVSIAALAALALPGLGGLLVVSGVGVRIGYRQAKANFVMQASGIARFAGPGPLGVVRSGSFIAVSRRAGAVSNRAERRQAAAAPLSVVAFDQAA
ncbi:uncharacterized protein RMCC_1127 [Mycolicibacterium canariasense]|uniref:Uncharacterized protein n=2 Tax=Mycolicibacterium canariasense TaxID=228230 RepID=A0A100W9Q9_MYCCR|nr:hypothetical protein [Mycolicibacterium canariasense]ORU99932.1 hypothetical protein AWB94_27810 [Mycolicibacterium canariasense]GAS94161.1 uncharacterized protein RMCC_1127 [Mycolicibacterium canariasense]